MKSPFLFLAFSIALPSISSAALVTGSLEYHWDANDAVNATAATWTSTGPGSTPVWTHNSNGATKTVTLGAVASPATTINRAYSYKGFAFGTDQNGSSVRAAAFNPGESSISTPSASFEFWIRPTNLLASQSIIFETGGGGRGWGLTLWGDELRASIKTSSGGNDPAAANTLAHTLTAADITDFLQVVVTFDDGSDTMAMYVNPVGAATPNTAVDTSSPWAGDHWQGTSNSGLGGVTDFGENNGFGGGAPDSSGATWAPSNFTGFDGQIANVRVYNKTLTGTEVAQNYNSMIPEPGSAALLLTGVAALGLRRRR